METGVGTPRGRVGHRPIKDIRAEEGATIAQIAPINEYLFDAIASRDAIDAQLINCCGDLWQVLARDARKRLAQYPMLMLDLRFRDSRWWRGVSEGGSSDWHTTVTEPPAKTSVALSRQALTLAWHTAHFANASMFLLGISLPVNQIIAKLGPQDIERIALCHHRELRLRWADCPAFWRALLQAARDRDGDRWGDMQRHGLQLLGRDFLALAEKATLRSSGAHGSDQTGFGH